MAGHPAARHSEKSAAVTGKEFGISGGESWAEFMKERSRDWEEIRDCGKVPWSRRNPSNFRGKDTDFVEGL